MVEDLEDLTEFCQRQAGDTLQSIFTYTATGGEIIYARKNMQAVFDSDGFGRFREAAWAVHETVLDEEPKIEVLGQYRVTVHTFANAFAMQFRVTPDEGIVIAFDRDVGRNLHEFLLECERYIAE